MSQPRLQCERNQVVPHFGFGSGWDDPLSWFNSPPEVLGNSRGTSLKNDDLSVIIRHIKPPTCWDSDEHKPNDDRLRGNRKPVVGSIRSGMILIRSKQKSPHYVGSDMFGAVGRAENPPIKGAHLRIILNNPHAPRVTTTLRQKGGERQWFQVGFPICGVTRQQM